ncbi:hypothetical protein [Streptomyces sp. NPDC051219]|uniref:hypothetical protein n=1 Tax=Streptomyces sp. NPDC051219 TaxID=3155283 RepID=UPI00341EA9E9
MPFTLRRSRRSLLAGAAGAAGAALLAGCSDPATAGGKAARASVSAERRMREQAARESTQLLARYDATAAAHPALAARLAPLRAEVAAHARAFGAAAAKAGPPPAPTAPGSQGTDTGPAGSGPAASGPPPVGSTVPGEPNQALAALAAAERRTADARTAALLGAPGELARLMASVAAAGSVHAYLLTSGEPK